MERTVSLDKLCWRDIRDQVHSPNGWHGERSLDIVETWQEGENNTQRFQDTVNWPTKTVGLASLKKDELDGGRFALAQ
jgi:hypothetical protein